VFQGQCHLATTPRDPVGAVVRLSAACQAMCVRTLCPLGSLDIILQEVTMTSFSLAEAHRPSVYCSHLNGLALTWGIGTHLYWVGCSQFMQHKHLICSHVKCAGLAPRGSEVQGKGLMPPPLHRELLMWKVHRIYLLF
jgi:hypothetical protein